MSTSVISSLNNNRIVHQPLADINSPSCKLQWRMGKLLVKNSGKLPQPYLHLVDNEQSLIECLKHSPVSLVSIDPKLGNSFLRVWADACKQADKPIFLNLPAYRKSPKKSNQILGILLRIADWNLALFLLIFMSPVIWVLFIITQIYSPGLLYFYEWYVGEKGQLFQVIKFSSNAKYEKTRFHNSIDKYFLENLSNLLNVLQGKFCLVNNRCLSLEDTLKLSLEEQDTKLNQLPELINTWQIKAKNKMPTT